MGAWALVLGAKAASEQTHHGPRQSQPPTSEIYTLDSEGTAKHTEKPTKILEWSALPLLDTSSSERTQSDTSSCQMALHSGAKKTTGHPTQGTNLASSEQMQENTRSFNGYTEG